MSTTTYILWYVFQAFVVLVVSVVVYFAYRLHQLHKKYDFLPGPPRDSFLLGNIPSIQKVVKEGGIIDDYLVDMANKYGSTYRFTVLNKTFVVITNPDGIKDLLLTGNHPKAKSVYDQLHSILGARFIGKSMDSETDNKLWVKRRMICDQWFRPMLLRKLAPDMNEMADVFVNKLYRYADGKTPVKMSEEYLKIALDMLAKIGFGMEFDTVRKGNHPFAEALHTSLSGFAEAMNNPFLQYNPFKWNYCRDVRKSCNYMRTFAKQRMAERRQAKKRGDYVPDDLLTYVMKMGDEITYLDEEDLVDDFVSLLSAGHETTSSLLASVTFNLAQNKECLQRLQNEIDEVLGAKAIVTHDDFGKLDYLEMVIKETFRMYPPVLHIFRENTNEYQLNGYTMPAGTEYYISMYASSRCNANVKDPEKFIPERHSPESDEKITQYVLYPFSVGPRNCIGKKYAEDEFKTILVKMIQSFNFELVPGQNMEIEDCLTLRLKGEATCYLKRRAEN